MTPTCEGIVLGREAGGGRESSVASPRLGCPRAPAAGFPRALPLDGRCRAGPGALLGAIQAFPTATRLHNAGCTYALVRLQ